MQQTMFCLLFCDTAVVDMLAWEPDESASLFWQIRICELAWQCQAMDMSKVSTSGMEHRRTTDEK